MNYKEAFAVDEIYFRDRKNEKNYIAQKFQLNNFDYYEPKLIDDFYLKYFLNKILIEIDILEVKEFLEYHYENSEKAEIFMGILKYKVIPKANDVVLRASFSLEDGGYFDKIKLDDGFIEIEERIFKSEYGDSLLYHVVAIKSLQEDIKSRISIISDFIERINNLNSNNSDVAKLKWSGKPSHLAFFIANFIEEGYISAPRKRSGDINFQELSRNIFNSFDFETKPPSLETLKKYSNTDSDKFLTLNERFNEVGFLLPNSKILD